MQIETVYEFNQVSFSAPKTEKREFQDWLIKLSSDLKRNEIIDDDFLELTSDGIRFKNYCGFISQKGFAVEILPKVFDPGKGSSQQRILARNSLLTMMSYTEMWKLPDDYGTGMRRDSTLPLHEMLFHIFLKGLLSELTRGLFLNYSQSALQDTNMRGSLHIERQIREPDKTLFHLRVFEYDHKNKLNSFFNSICRIISSTSNIKDNRVKAMRALSILEGNETMSARELSQFEQQFNRLSERFLSPFLLGKVIVGHSSLVTESSKLEVPIILVDMNKLFEKFFATFLQKNKHLVIPGFEVLEQPRGRWFLLRGQNVELRPDIVLQREEGEAIVMDTKYKSIDPGAIKGRGNQLGIRISDLYQMFAYARKIGSKRLFLVYPTSTKLSATVSKIGNFDEDSEVFLIRVLLNFDSVSWPNKLVSSLLDSEYRIIAS